MEIPNLNSNPSSKVVNPISNQKSKTFPIFLVILFFSLVVGFVFSQLYPINKDTSVVNLVSGEKAISTDSISNADQIQVGKLYGDTDTTFKDSATGTIEKGSINGVGTHILNREGGTSQRASLTSSVVDLDLFVGKKVEVKGQTNSSNKTAWLMDVGSIKVLE